MKNLVLHSLLIILSFPALSQKVIDLGDKNPNLKGPARVRHAILDDTKLYLAGNINFVNDEITPPIVRLNSDGSLDDAFNFKGHYSNDFENDLSGLMAALNGSLYINGANGIVKINNDGSIDDSFEITGLNFIKSMISYRDSLLVIGNGAQIHLYSEDGNYRIIETGLSTDYYLQSLTKLSSDKVLIRVQDKISSAFKLYMFNDELIEDSNFLPVSINQPGDLKHIELLSNGNIFISGKNIVINETSGNGIYLIDEKGSIDASSPHETDLSFIDVYDYGIEFAIPLSDGKIMVVGHADNSNYSTFALVRLLSSGLRDDTFLSRNIEIDDVNSQFNMITDSNNDIILEFSQTKYDDLPSRSINKIDVNGNNIDTYKVDVYGITEVNQFMNYDSDKFLITGSFIESANTTTPLVSGFSFNDNVEFPWLASVDLAIDDIMGSAKVLSNGDIFIGAYDRSNNGIFKVYNSDGTAVDISSIQTAAIFVQRPVYNIHESDDFIYSTGLFTYTSDAQTKRSILKMNKDYSTVADYTPSSEILTEDIIAFSYLTKDDKLIIQHSNHTNSTDNVIRLLENGGKDNSFNDIIGDMNFGRSKIFVVNDSLIMLYESDFNDTQTLKVYDLDGTLIDDNFISINADSYISNISHLSDTTIIVSGSFSTINNIQKDGIAILNYNGLVYDDLSLDITGSIDQVEIFNDTLYILGPGAVNGHNGAGFYALTLQPNAIEIESVSTTNEGGIELAWKEDPTIRSIEIFRMDTENVETLLVTLEKGSTSFVDESAEVNTLYNYKVVSNNVLGENESLASYEVVKPSRPSNVVAQFEVGNNTLTWSDESDNEIEFQIYRSVDDNDFVIIKEITANTIEYTDENIEVDHDYSYFLVALSENFQSDPSDTVIISVYRPASPEGLNYDLTAGQINGVMMNIYWSISDNETDSFIIFESSDNVQFDPIDTLDVSSLAFSKEIEIDQFYYYNVVAKSEVGNSDPSDVVIVNTFRPESPEGLYYEFDNNIINLGWSISEDRVDAFIIYESLDASEFYPIDTVEASVSTYERNIEVKDVLYYYYIVAQNVAGNSSPSEQLEVNTTILGMNPLGNSLSIYPNPSDGQLKISLNSQSIDLVKILDINGRVVREINPIDNVSIEVLGLQRGVYLLSFLSKNIIVESQRVIVK
ncbi:MAG: T9SS type A sorting domain-containing protein [Reichenbachiella sp.]